MREYEDINFDASAMQMRMAWLKARKELNGERERERETDRQTDRQTDTETERNMDVNLAT